MANVVVTNPKLDGFEGSTDFGGKTIDLDMAGTKVSLSVSQASELQRMLALLVRQNRKTFASKTIEMKEPKPRKKAEAK